MMRPETRQRTMIHRSWLADRAETRRPTTAPVIAFRDLSERQRAVLALIAQGRTNADIGRALSISDQTVKNHLTVIFRRLSLAAGDNRRVLATIWYLRQQGDV